MRPLLSLKLLTLNLHNPSSRALRPIADLLDASGAELCVLTECDEAATRRLGELLSCPGVAHAYAPYWGNGLLTRTLELESSGTIDLPRATTGELRSAVEVEVRAPWGPLRVLGTHLEHLREEDRLRQLRHLHGRADLESAVLLGDLNSLRRSDYTAERWEEIAEQRARTRLTAPAIEVTSALFEELQLIDAHDARVPGEPLAPTCPYGTRIDYICIGRASGARPTPGSYRVLDAMGPGLTDHDAVLVELEPA